MKINTSDFKWTHEPKVYTINQDSIEITTEPFTDLWQRTYYHFRNDNAPILQLETTQQYFSFIVKTEFEKNCRYDQCGIAVYLDSENWIKASIEGENNEISHIGAVVTNNGFSDWSTGEISANITSMWYRLSRRENDFKIECSLDGVKFQQLRICHLFNSKEKIQFGIYVASPENSSFKSIFTNLEITECKWLAHDGQQPDEIE
ncbi:hypothetical protein AN641_00990 [Candidatus Epulonipiscioides gigas]|nr:hypothetical protein AN641_00990 [Epulopiscium sp. SCG-C07WGA-EpuloA2]